MTRGDKKKRIMKRRRVSFLIIIALILVSSIAFGTKAFSKYKLKNYVKENFGDRLKPSLEDKQVGEVESKVTYDRNSLIAVHYPKLGLKKADKNIKNIVDGYVTKFKEDNKDFEANRPEDIKKIHIDYESYDYKQKITSIKFKIDEKEDNSKIFTSVYSNEEDKGLKLKDLFIDEALPFIAKETINQFSSIDTTKELMNDKNIINSLENDINNYSNFLMHDDGLEILLPQISKEESIFLDYDDLEMYAKYDLETLETLSEKEIEEKIENAQLGFKIRPGLDPSKPMVALTYDDGPYEKVTGPILDQLKKYNGAATFFVLGEKVNANKELIQRMADEGHEIGNHSYSHKQLTKLSVDGLMKEVNDTQSAVQNVVGFEPDLLRPTYGAINETVSSNVPMPLMLWSIDTLDWKYRNTDRVTASILNNVKDGDIILMHDLYDSTREASLKVIPELVNRGYQLVTLTEMYELKGIELKAGERYTNID